MKQPEPIGNTIWKVLGRLGIAEEIRERQVLNRWVELVGPLIAQAARPLRLENGLLWVAVKSHTWAQELQFQGETILERLNEAAGKRIFHAVRFVVRTHLPEGLELPGEELVEDHKADEIAEQEIVPPERNELEEATASIEEPVLQEAVRQARMAEIKFHHWRLKHGWQPCTRCGALHNESQPLCFLCRED